MPASPLPIAEPSPSPHESMETVVAATLIRTVMEGLPTNAGLGIFGAAFLASVSIQSSPRGLVSIAPWVWLFVMVMLMLGGVVMGRSANRQTWESRGLLRHGKTLAGRAAIAGAMWGSASWLLLPLAAVQGETFVVMGIAMILMGGAGGHAAYRPTLLAFTVPFMVVFAAGLIRFGDWIHVVLGIGFLVFGLVTVTFARNQGEAMRKQVLASLESESLRAIADSASRAKTAFLAAASHDLRQPMHALVQYCAHLKRANRDPQLNDTVQRIQASLDAMRDLLDSILDLSKLMMGGVQPAFAMFPVAAVLERLDAQLRPLATAKGLRLVVIKSNVMVKSDDVLLERILRNLLLNAIRYTDRGQITLRCRVRRGELRLQVWDTGIGIPRPELARIFDPFYQVDNKARDRRKGLGLGLAIVRQLCDLLGHRIQVRSVVAVGTLFVVRVPLGIESTAAIDVRSAVEASTRDFVSGAFIVLIDDDSLSREASEHTLLAFGCRVLTAASGIEAIAQLQHQEFAPQLIIADYRMESETGIEAIEMVTENLSVLFGPPFSIPALVVSGDTSPEELRRVNDCGYPMLHKPVASEDLWRAMNHLLELKAREANF